MVGDVALGSRMCRRAWFFVVCVPVVDTPDLGRGQAADVCQFCVLAFGTDRLCP